MARKRKKSKQVRQILGNGKEAILTIQNGQIVGKRNVRKRKKMMNVFDPMTKVEMDFA